MMQAKERLYFTADKTELVGAGDERAAILYAAIGDEIPDSMVDKFGLVDGMLAAAADAAASGDDPTRAKAGAKEAKPGGDKEKKPDGDKGGDKDGDQDQAPGGDQAADASADGNG